MLQVHDYSNDNKAEEIRASTWTGMLIQICERMDLDNIVTRDVLVNDLLLAIVNRITSYLGHVEHNTKVAMDKVKQLQRTLMP